MSDGVYPTTGWTSNLARLPRISSPDLARLASCSGTEKGARRSYKLVTESYVVASTVCANYDEEMASRFFLRARCFRSHKKTQPPYTVSATITKDGELVNGYCECPAGKQACSHLQAVLKTVILIQGKGFTEAPAHLSCTDLPQRWRRPRGQVIKGSSVQGVDWRRVGKGRQDLPRSCRLDLSKAKERTISQKKSAALQFASSLQQLDGMTSLVAVLGAADRAQVCSSKCGDVLACSPLAYQQPLVPFGFCILLCEELEAPGHLNIGRPLEEMVPFLESDEWTVPDGVSTKARLLLEKITLTPLEAQDLEKNSRRQRDSATWLQARQYRLTASNFGTVHRHGEWTEKGLANLTSTKDLSRVPAIRYGIVNEPKALQRYEDVLKSRGRDVHLSSAGLFVDPDQPWLGATPDAIVYDATEQPPWGCVEVKCLYTLRNADRDTLLASNISVAFDSSNRPHLKTEHPHFAQVVGQMGVTNLKWADYVLYGINFLTIQRIRFDKNIWEDIKESLDNFYFTTLLPYFAAKS
ncbi:uncharacterized protein LOC115330270 [Ixodes scapularis]|uniref:uncharacterized protein LOC115330270 n=1 Tax=Ixodes scapularis TaxID=6945 RepID=UPI001AD67A54|nr:uncharacterized protein LOC115330270 [Ixodes scapularis]